MSGGDHRGGQGRRGVASVEAKEEEDSKADSQED
jgi:hypothetical protein